MIYILKYIFNWIPYKYKMIEYKKPDDDWDIIEKCDYIDQWLDSIIEI